MKKHFVWFALVLAFLASLTQGFTGCGEVEGKIGSSSKVTSGSMVTLTLHPDGRIKVVLEGDSTIYYVDKDTLAMLKSAKWVKSDGSEWDLRQMIQGSKDPLKGSWLLLKAGEKYDLKVYKDATMAKKALEAATK